MNENKARNPDQDALASLGGMVSFRRRVVKVERGRERSEYKGKTIMPIDSLSDRC
jgi:hypothetical protein